MTYPQQRPIWLLIFWLVCSQPSVADESKIDYNRDIRPILSDKCYQCHGPDEAERQTNLRLDEQTSAFSEVESGDRAIVPGDADDSEIIRRITAEDDDLKMPPPETAKRVSSDELTLLKQWIQSGAKWGTHWAFAGPIRPRLPEVQNTSWPKNAIDYFILETLESKSWSPAPEADNRTLIRRATLATIGLPPSQTELKSFLSNSSPNAYEQMVDRLLQSPRFGEHQTRFWLDLARYGDTHGLHLDNERSIWRYRDWVLDAFNTNMPFDQFTIEQLAGDLLPKATLDQKIATGFHRCNVTTSEGGAIAEEFLARYAVDRVETTSAVWLGLTTGCAACHDHKFDPISQKEFYQLYAYFYNLTEKAMDGNAKLPPPSVKAPTFLQQLEQQKLVSEKETIDAKIQLYRNQLKADRTWEQQLAATFVDTTPAPTDALLHLRLDDEGAVANGKIVGKLLAIPGHTDAALSFQGESWIELEDFGRFENDHAFSFAVWVQIDNDGANTVLSRMDDGADFQGYDLYISAGKIFVHMIKQWPEHAIRVNTVLPIRKEKWHHIVATYDGSRTAAGIKIYVDGVPQDLERTHDSLDGSIRTAEPFRIGSRQQSARFHGGLDELLVFDRLLVEDEIQALMDSNPLADYLRLEAAHRTTQQDDFIIERYMRTEPRFRAVLDQSEGVKKRIAKLEQSIPSTLVMEERKEPREAYVLVRGEYDNQGDQVDPNVPAALPPSTSTEQSRLSLARWLVDENHPLTARVTVNRIWQQYFGVGIVKTSEDFGSQGEWPSHPKLLDYLATKLIASGWDLKALHREILLSATFQQSSHIAERSLAEDPENRLLSHGPRFRLDAETIRDIAMAASGLLVGELGGPSVKPYQPAGLWKAVGYTSSNTANFKSDTDEKLYRRGMYTFWKRTSPPPQMQILDAPSREVCTIRRPRTNTPAAALLLMNDIQFVEAARNLADRLLAGDTDDDRRLDNAFELCLSRLPSPSERKVLRDLLHSNLVAFRHNPNAADELLSLGDSPARHIDRNELAAWTLVCSTVLNLDEAINQH